MDAPLNIFAGTSVPDLAEEVANLLGLELGRTNIKRFANGEIYVRFQDTVRGNDVFVIQSLCSPVNDNLVELLLMVDALKRASAGRINAIVPHYGYSRQERKEAPREPISARMVADILTTVGVDRVITLDLHAPAIQGFFNIPVDHLTALPLLAEYYRKKNLENACVVALDAGGIKRAEKLAKRLDLPLIGMYKRHPEHNVSQVTHVMGDIEGKAPLIIEDMIDTGGTLLEGVKALLAHGARPEIHVCATHAVFSHPIEERLAHPAIKEVLVTNTIPVGPEIKSDKVKTLSIAPLLASTITRVHEESSVSSLFN